MRSERPSRWQSPWLWIGLSCGVIVLGVAGLIVVANLAIFKSYQQVRERARQGPLLSAAERLAVKDPDVKVLSRDKENQRITLRNEKTGERFVFAEAEKGQLMIQTGGDEVALQWGRFDGRLRLGRAAGQPPSWVPVAPGLPLRPVYASSAGGVASGCAVVIANTSIQEVYDRYQEVLSERGFAVLPSGDSLSASAEDSRLTIFLSPSPGNPRKGILTWSELSRESAEE